LIKSLLVRARQAGGLSQASLAKLAGTSRPTLSAYERGRKSPTLETAARIIEEAGFELSLTPRIDFHEAAVAAAGRSSSRTRCRVCPSGMRSLW